MFLPKDTGPAVYFDFIPVCTCVRVFTDKRSNSVFVQSHITLGVGARSGRMWPDRQGLRRSLTPAPWLRAPPGMPCPCGGHTCALAMRPFWRGRCAGVSGICGCSSELAGFDHAFQSSTSVMFMFGTLGMRLQGLGAPGRGGLLQLVAR